MTSDDNEYYFVDFSGEKLLSSEFRMRLIGENALTIRCRKLVINKAPERHKVNLKKYDLHIDFTMPEAERNRLAKHTKLVITQMFHRRGF